MTLMDNLHSTAWGTSTSLLSQDVHTQLHPPTSPDHHTHFSTSFPSLQARLI